MKMSVCVVVLVCLISTAVAEESVPAFPGAEGFGAASIGGRGGKVVHVTSLADDGPGSLREALAVEGPRIIVFDVGGTIELKNFVKAANGNGRLTIAGQTAPGGITLIGATLALPGWMKGVLITEDMIVRHMRVRGVHNIAKPGQGGDCFNFYRVRRAIMDHCSFTGSCDETVDCLHASDLTVQWCTIEESAKWGQGGNQHAEGDHNYGMIIGYDGVNASVHHTLFAHHMKRCPAPSTDPSDIRNNVNYNCGAITTDCGSNFFKPEAPMRWNVVGCTFRPGPILGSQGYCIAARTPETHFIYAEGNDFQLFGGLVDPWAIREPGGGDKGKFIRGRFEPMYREAKKLSEPVACAPVTTQSAAEAYKLVLATAGAWPRDATTRRTIREVETQTGEWGLSGPYERFAEQTDGPTSEKNDTDRDGMPDAWEAAHGLNPSDPSDGNKIVPKGASEGDRHAGYTFVEYYINELSDKLVGADGPLCTVKVATDGPGRIVCGHGGRTPLWNKPKPPRYTDWGTEATFNKGSSVVLRALPQAELTVGATEVSTFDHWSGGPVDGSKDPVVTVVVDQDMEITAHFVAK